MGVFDDGQAEVGSLVAATLETAGAGLQSDMLDMITGAEDGLYLVGLLYLIGIVTAVLTIAIGGQYKWGRYLLVGPAIFFFLTTVRVGTEGTSWKFGQKKFDPELRAKMLRGVMDYEGGKRSKTDVSYFFLFWNNFTTGITQELINVVGITEDDSHMNFLTKIDRYMAMWDGDFINDNNLRMLIRVALVAECSDYFNLLVLQAKPEVSITQKQFYQSVLDKRTKSMVFSTGGKAASPGQKQMIDFMVNASQANAALGVEGQVFEYDSTYTCQQLWEGIVGILRSEMKANLEHELNGNQDPNQDPDKTRSAFYRRMYIETSRATSQTRFHEKGGKVNADGVLNDDVFNAALLRAVDWMISRTLFHEISGMDRYSSTFDFEGATGNRATGMGGMTNQSDETFDTANNIQQFNRTEKYLFKADYVNAALSLPHFQGVVLMLLSASFPFFAMMTVLPGRAHAIFTWMSLWLWAKLWDLGFAVVMMIDNILYAMFPRGPNIEPEDVKNAGTAFVRVMEVDPNYSSATYYNLIATCLYAVPAVTGMFVKGGASELVNAVQGSWQQYSGRLAASAATFARSLQAQSISANFQKGMHDQVNLAQGRYKSSAEYAQIDAEYQKWDKIDQVLQGGSKKDIAKALSGLKVGGGVAPAAKVAQAWAKAEKQRLGNLKKARMAEVGARAAYDYSTSKAGFWASESAVAAKYYSHDFASAHPGRAEMNSYLSNRSFDKESIVSAGGDQALKAAIGGFTPTPGGKK